jgi:hypothetical protein
VATCTSRSQHSGTPKVASAYCEQQWHAPASGTMRMKASLCKFCTVRDPYCQVLSQVPAANANQSTQPHSSQAEAMFEATEAAHQSTHVLALCSTETTALHATHISSQHLRARCARVYMAATSDAVACSKTDKQSAHKPKPHSVHELHGVLNTVYTQALRITCVSAT